MSPPSRLPLAERPADPAEIQFLERVPVGHAVPLALIAVGLAFVLNYVGAAAGLTAFDGPGERSLVLAVAFAVAVLIQVAALVWWMLLGHVNGFRTRRSPQAPSLHQLAGPYGG